MQGVKVPCLPTYTTTKKGIFDMINKFIMWYMQRQLKRLQKTQNTPYIFIKGTGKDYPKYLMYTNSVSVRETMQSIQ